MRIIPNGWRVVAEFIEIAAINGIHTPGMETKGSLRVIEVGDGLLLQSGVKVPVPYKAGDEIIAHPAGCQILPPELYGGKKLVTVSVDSILAKVERKHATDGIGQAIIRPAVALDA